MWMILMVLVVGMVAGWVASLVVRGDRRPSDWGLLLAVGIGGSAFAGPVWSLVAFIAILSLGETLLSPVASAEVADLAPEAVRGRYMGVWTIVWNGGAALGPAFGGWAMDTVGGREAFVALLVVGLAGAVWFLALAPGWSRRRRASAAEARATA
jgi:MFS family permease